MTRRIALLALTAVAAVAVGIAFLVSWKPARPDPNPAADAAGVPWFADVTAAAGVRFDHFDSGTSRYAIPEPMGSGIGWIDYDADGWPDLFCVQAGPLPPASPDPSKTHRLFRNNRDGTLTDVTAAVGLDKPGFGQGCAVGDFDNDGYDDLLVTYFGSIQLFRNVPDPRAPGGRRFADVTAAAGLSDPHWATSCGWADVDGDGFLDLYVCNYVEVDLANYPVCEHGGFKKPHICPPTVFPTVADKLFRNNGNGTFTDASESSGVAAVKGAGLAVTLLDMDGDGRTDIYVANDLGPAYLFHNQGGGRFAEAGRRSGAGFDRQGRVMSGMGIAAGDVDGSGRPSLLVTNYQNEPTELFLNRGKMQFLEWSHPSGLGPATLRTLGFGIDLFDADNDGRHDIVQANGHVFRNAEELLGHPAEQTAQLLLGDGAGRFREVTAEAGGYFRARHLGRGVAVADFDNDGRADLAFSHNAGPLKLLRNALPNGNSWVRLELIGDGTASNRSAIGAKIEIRAGGRTLTRWIHGGGSYLSASDRRVVIGLGPSGRIDAVTVVWPSGKRQEFPTVTAGRGWRLTEGRPEPEQAAARAGS